MVVCARAGGGKKWLWINCLCQLSDLIGRVDLVQKVFMGAISLSAVVMTEQGINVVQRQWPDIGKLLNLCGNHLGILILEIGQLKLLDTVLDCIPASKTMTNANVS